MVRQPMNPLAVLISSVRFLILGIVVVLFFKCMSALLNPLDRTSGGIKWPFVAHTTVMFSFLTINIAMSLNISSISYIDNRAFPGDETLSPGPFGYQTRITSKAISIVPNVLFLLNNCLADCLLVNEVSNSIPEISYASCRCSSFVATLSIP
jgi:hypothetical protein